MKIYLFPTLFLSVMLGACSQKPQYYGYTITPPSVIKSPDFRNLPTDSCKNGEYISSPAKLYLNKQGKVTAVSGLQIQDKKLANEITNEFKKAKYTPYRKNGTAFAHHLDAAIRLKCPPKPNTR